MIQDKCSEALYIGLMSGTSLDGIDAALVNISNEGNTIELLHATESPIEATLKSELQKLCAPAENEIVRSGQASIEIAIAFSAAVKNLLKAANISAKQIAAIGSHGQTIRHHPEAAFPFTVQIGDPSTIAELTGITTVADFRPRDMAAGGEGAPLAPAFHEQIFGSRSQHCHVVNIGGIANLSVLDSRGPTRAFDTGPGNTLMDQWIQQHQQQKYDKNGHWASSGKSNAALLNKLLTEPYFHKPPPKSTGRELFNLPWLKKALQNISEEVSPADVQATLLQLTVQTISHDILQYGHNQGEIFVCGGGSENIQLMEALQSQLPAHTVLSSDAAGVSSQYMEAMAFAWLAFRTHHQLTGNLPDVTGAGRAVILGGIYPANAAFE